MHTLASPFLGLWLARTSHWICLFINTNPVQDVSLEYAGPLVSVAVIIVTIIAVVYCWGSLYGWYIMAYCGDLFCAHTLVRFYNYIATYLWGPILYIRNFLMTYSVHKPSFVGVFSISTTYFDQNTPHTRDYFGLFCIFIFPWWAILYWSDVTVLVHLATYSVHILPLGGLLCT